MGSSLFFNSLGHTSWEILQEPSLHITRVGTLYLFACSLCWLFKLKKIMFYHNNINVFFFFCLIALIGLFQWHSCSSEGHWISTDLWHQLLQCKSKKSILDRNSPEEKGSRTTITRNPIIFLPWPEHVWFKTTNSLCCDSLLVSKVINYFVERRQCHFVIRGPC